MSIHFHPLRISSIRQETPECISVVFDIPEDLQQQFKFTQGQSLTMRKTIAGEEVRRTYSICSSPFDQELRVAIKKQEGGLFSGFAHDLLRAGDTLDVMEPIGKFYTQLDPTQKKNYLAIAAGSGITPVLSLIKTTLATEPYSRFTLVYGNRNRNAIIFFEELEAIKNKYLQRFQLIHVLSREKTETLVNSGRINAEKLAQLEKLISYSQIDEIFLCGPEEMIFGAKAFLEKKNIDTRKIHFELFTTPGIKQSQASRASSIAPLENKSAITIKLDGRTFEFELGLNAGPILDAALKEGADLPYACKGGVCCTCKAKLLEGEVEMDVHWGLEDEEIKQGYILTCQSHPLTDKVVIDFDIK
ncbi:MAG: phenylacetate-CoA oxygenase/reductase subunit PaaK [Chitinophagaceae bacterium]|nr:MAG: phenylacetate-CoA oxygenase/reductase subunit PaaK [Chitinophagaceae bacterium]